MSTLHLVHLSLDTFLPDAKVREDLESALELRPHLAAFTEAGQHTTVALAGHVAGLRGYVAVNPDAGDILFAVREDLRIVDHGGELAVPAAPRSAGHVQHGPRHNSWVRFHLGDEDITHSSCHLVTGFSDDPARREQDLHQAELLGRQVEAFGAGHRISTWSGDLNSALPNNDQLDALLTSHGMWTTAAKTGVDTATHGPHRIDYVGGSHDPRVEVESFKVHRGPKFHSDHDPLEAWLKIHAPAGSPA